MLMGNTNENLWKQPTPCFCMDLYTGTWNLGIRIPRATAAMGTPGESSLTGRWSWKQLPKNYEDKFLKTQRKNIQVNYFKHLWVTKVILSIIALPSSFFLLIHLLVISQAIIKLLGSPFTSVSLHVVRVWIVILTAWFIHAFPMLQEVISWFSITIPFTNYSGRRNHTEYCCLAASFTFLGLLLQESLLYVGR